MFLPRRRGQFYSGRDKNILVLHINNWGNIICYSFRHQAESTTRQKIPHLAGFHVLAERGLSGFLKSTLFLMPLVDALEVLTEEGRFYGDEIIGELSIKL